MLACRPLMNKATIISCGKICLNISMWIHDMFIFLWEWRKILKNFVYGMKKKLTSVAASTYKFWELAQTVISLLMSPDLPWGQERE